MIVSRLTATASGPGWPAATSSSASPGTAGPRAGAAQALLRAGQLDEMEIHLVPVLLGEGRRLFDSLGPGHIELELVRRVEGRDVTHLRYRVSR